MDPRRALSVLRRWWPVLVVGTLLAAAVAYGVSKSMPRVYQATALLDVAPGLGTTGGGQDFNEVQAAAWQAATDAQLIHTTPIAQAAIHQLHLDGRLDPGTLLKNTVAQSTPQMRTVTLAVRANNPADAANLANAMARLFVAQDARERTAGNAAALKIIESKITYYSRDEGAAYNAQARLALHPGTPTAQQAAQGRALAERIATDQSMLSQLNSTASGIQLNLAGVGSTTSLAQPATPPSDAISPRTSVNVLVAAVLALLILLGIAFLVDYFDDRPRSAADVAAGLDLPLAGTIGAARGNAALVVLEEPASAQADQYRALRAGLDALRRDGSASVLLVAGVQRGDGATTVATNLAAAAARAGSRVVLVDANLRQPTLHTTFRLPDRAGLTTTLRAEGDPLALLHETALPGLRVLTAGPAPADAIDLLGSERMRATLAALRAACDLVVIDTATVDGPDAAALAPHAETVLVVARLGAARLPTLAAAGQRLRLSGARLAGVVVTLFEANAAPSTAVRGAAASAASETAQAETAQPHAGLRSAK